MKISRQARREAKELFRSAFAEGQLDENAVRLRVQAVIEKKPRGYLGILTHLQRLVRLETERRTARVESAVDLDPALRRQVEESLSRSYGPGLRFEFAHNPALIGGMRVKVGSDVYDGTVLTRLNRLKEQG